MPRYFSAAELDHLKVLREGFLSFEQREDAAGEGPYWLSLDELALYDGTFGERIGWKWDAVLLELARRARWPAAKSVLDWGCGSGVAARRVLAAREGIERLWLWDHSPVALEFAAGRVREEFPAVEVRTEIPEEPVDALLVSHVLGELGGPAQEELLALAGRAGSVLWVEPGSRRTSRRLGEVRERFRATHDVLAPCTHQAACGALAGGDDLGRGNALGRGNTLGRGNSWCHFFARPAGEVYTEGKWAEFAREIGIDLRSLPYSFLVVARRGAVPVAEGPSARLLGRPRLSRGRAEFELCRAEGVATVDFLQRTDKAVFKELDDVAGVPWLFEAEVEGRRISALARRDT